MSNPPADYTRRDLEPLSFDDLPLGGEWTTRRRTVSEAEIALFAGVAGDLSPLTIETDHGSPRAAPPALVVAIAVGLGTVDMPVPSIAEWEWLNWRFPRQVRAGDTVYARWTLTQKRPPVGGAPSSIVVWRVDVHTADGALCAEGEIGAKVKRRQGAARPRVETAGGARPVGQAASAGTSRRRRRRARGNGAQADAPPVAAGPASEPKPPERASGASSRRRRRRRPSGSTAREEERETRSAPVAERAPEAEASPAQGAGAAAARGGDRSTISRVLKRLRGA